MTGNQIRKANQPEERKPALFRFFSFIYRGNLAYHYPSFWLEMLSKNRNVCSVHISRIIGNDIICQTIYVIISTAKNNYDYSLPCIVTTICRYHIWYGLVYYIYDLCILVSYRVSTYDVIYVTTNYSYDSNKRVHCRKHILAKSNTPYHQQKVFRRFL